MRGVQNSSRYARLQFDVQIKGTPCKRYSYRARNMAKFGTQKEASRTKSIKFPFQYGRYKFIFLGIVFYQIVGLQVEQAEASWPRDTYGEYKRVELWRSKRLSHLIKSKKLSSYGCMQKVEHERSLRVSRGDSRVQLSLLES